MISALLLPGPRRRVIYVPVEILPGGGNGNGPPPAEADAKTAPEPRKPTAPLSPAVEKKPEPVAATVATPKPPAAQKPKPSATALATAASTAPAVVAQKPGYSLEAAGEGMGGPSMYFGYLGLLRRKVSERWSPLWWSGGEDRIAEIRFVLQADGRAKDISIQKPSGLPQLDRSALRAITEAGPFPPIPPEYPDKELGITFRFILTRAAP